MTVSPSKWVAVARSGTVGRKPVAFSIDGTPLVIFRLDDKLHCLLDRCPHRSTPLSGGRLVSGSLECPYHGWRFNGAGHCTAVPGHVGSLPRYRVPARPICEHGGLVYVATGRDPGEPYLTSLSGTHTAVLFAESAVRSTLAEVAENILDATHTHYIHKGVLRGLSDRRYTVSVTVSGGDGWVEARYEGEPRQEGLVSRLFEGERSVSIGRFIAPGIAEVEFWGRSGPSLVTTFHLRQHSPDEVRGIGILAGPAEGGLGFIKGLFLYPLFRLAVAQDRAILSAAHDRRKLFPEQKQVVGPLDVMRQHIDAILAGKRPSVADAPVTLTMEL
ncbi:MAG: Rieske 2Fe-2S domain-containing protein [Hyphomicrobiaceae bacterium]|nr:Rieske 2Fe-2S domain-containing protein [Hyphomicrobiaceae bacterium]